MVNPVNPCVCVCVCVCADHSVPSVLMEAVTSGPITSLGVADESQSHQEDEGDDRFIKSARNCKRRLGGAETQSVALIDSAYLCVRFCMCARQCVTSNVLQFNSLPFSV